jgi:hypothetical protein
MPVQPHVLPRQLENVAVEITIPKPIHSAEAAFYPAAK